MSVELELMKPWTGVGGPGYSKKIRPDTAPIDWGLPGRVIWKFDYEAIRNLSGSPYLHRLGRIVVPFAQLSFSISRLFQLYGEYRTFVNSDLAVWLAPPESIPAHHSAVFKFNFDIHVRLIGGEDSDDPLCLYKAYGAAVSALGAFEGRKRRFLGGSGWVTSLAQCVSSQACFCWSGHSGLWSQVVN